MGFYLKLDTHVNPQKVEGNKVKNMLTKINDSP